MIRKATVEDSKAIYTLINSGAKDGKVLRRSLNHIYENIRDFWVYFEGEKIIGCSALHVVGWQGLGEIKSLVVRKQFQNKGIGSRLIKHCLREAASLRLKKVFALTFVPLVFKKSGFKSISRKKLPHKIWSDCLDCPYFPNCREEAVIYRMKRRK